MAPISGADLLATELGTLTPHMRPSEMETELGRLSPLSPLLGVLEAGLRAGNMAEEDTRPLEAGQHLLISQGAEDRPGLGLGQASMQSSALATEPSLISPGPVSTNSGWIVVEWIPSLWKNSFTLSATFKCFQL